MNYIINTCKDAQWNMAHDEFLLEGLSGTVFCLWQNAPAVIIGRNQSAYAEVNLPFLEANNITLARRVTGGGAVYHDNGNLNYSIAGPSKEVEQHYDTMANALRQLGLNAERTGRNDIMVNGLKCSGWAKRLSKDRMMIHGTLMWDVNLQNLTDALSTPGSKLATAGIESVRSRVINLKPLLPQFKSIEEFREKLKDLLAGEDTEITLTDTQKTEITQKANAKFRTWDWIYGHSPETAFESTKKFACGTVTAHYTLNKGVFKEIHFTGDFIGRKPAEELAEVIKGLRPEDIFNINTEDYFDGLSAKEFAHLFS